MAPERKPRTRGAIRRFLVLVQTEGSQSLQDFFEIKQLVEAKAPDIRVVVVSNRSHSVATLRALPPLPTLIVSPYQLNKGFTPDRGVIHAGQLITKDVQQALLEKAKIPVPPSVVLAPGVQLDSAVFGDLVIVKPLEPAKTSHGDWIQLRRTTDVTYEPPETLPAHHPARLAPMLAQRFIDTGPKATSHRVLTLYGEPLYALRVASKVAMPDLAGSDDELRQASAASNGDLRTVEFFEDEAIFDLARRVHAVAPDVPLKGVDVLRDVRDGSLWVIEFNPGGNTWGFSTRSGARTRRRMQTEFPEDHPDAEAAGRRNYIKHLDGFRRAADVLIEQTRRCAR
ncbi:MAG: hypothetical protein K0R27_907 [Xanthobacteraceae bacterium]|jgi:hypothetical protein|nr:hypothetical protein [Xanthobacteraceae bacterium]